MNPFIHIYRQISLLLLASMCLVVVSCSSDDPQPVDKRNIYLTLNVVVNSGDGSSTRADNDYFFEDAQTDFERLHELRVVITQPNESNNVETVLHNRVVTFVKNEAGQYELRGNLTFVMRAGTYRIHLFGNESSLPEPAPTILNGIRENQVYAASAINAITLTRDQNSPLFDNTTNLPMAESFDITLTSEDADAKYKRADLFVTRIPVKFTFAFLKDAMTESMDKVTIRLADIAQTQYFTPHGVTYNPGKYTPILDTDGTELRGRAITAFTVPAPQIASVYTVSFDMKDLEIKEVNKPNTDSPLLYYVSPPVYLNETKVGLNGFRITITANNDIEYAAKTLPNLPDLPRNTHAVIRMKVTDVLNAEVDLAPYTGVYLNPSFGF